VTGVSHENVMGRHDVTERFESDSPRMKLNVNVYGRSANLGIAAGDPNPQGNARLSALHTRQLPVPLTIVSVSAACL